MAENDAKDTTGSKDKLLNFLVERKLREDSFPTKYVAFLDMLGFSALVKQFPGSLVLEVGGDYESLETSISASSQFFGRFHAALDYMAENYADSSRPERMMVFSDCAFCIYENPLQA